MHWDLDNSETWSSNCWTASALKCRNALAFGFTAPTHLYFFVALDIYISNMQRAFSSSSLKRLIVKDFSIFAWKRAHLGLQWMQLSLVLSYSLIRYLLTPIKKLNNITNFVSQIQLATPEDLTWFQNNFTNSRLSPQLQQSRKLGFYINIYLLHFCWTYRCLFQIEKWMAEDCKSNRL